MSMWLLQLAIIIVVRGCAGWLAERLGQCRVVGEIAAGILLGPSVIGAISPAFYTAMYVLFCGVALSVSAVPVMARISAWATTALGLHSAFGSLVAAILLRKVPSLQKQWDDHFDGFIQVVSLPVFFAYAGMHVSLTLPGGSPAWLWFTLFLSSACVGKFGGAYLGARLCGLRPRQSAIVGSLMNTRGLMELIVLSVGLEMRILPQGVYTILVLVALVTTAMTVPLVRLSGHFQPRLRVSVALVNGKTGTRVAPHSHKRL